MNGKITTNSQLSTTEPKKKNQKQNLSKQLEQEQNHRDGDHMEGYQGEWKGERVEKGTENKQHKWQIENRQGEGKNSIGNVEAKELISMTHGHELYGGNVGGRGQAGWSGMKGGNRTTVIA